MNVVESHPARKLSRALESSTPLLIVVNRDSGEDFRKAFALLEVYCVGKIDFLCGVANKGDEEYDNFNGWLSDPQPDSNRLVYLNTEKFEKYFYNGELATLTSEAVDQFLQDIKDGKILPHSAPEETPEAAAETPETVETPETAETVETAETAETTG